MEAAQALRGATARVLSETVALHAALVAARTLEAALMVPALLEVAHTLVVPTAAWGLILEVHTALEALTLVEVTSVAAAKAQACGLRR